MKFSVATAPEFLRRGCLLLLISSCAGNEQYTKELSAAEQARRQKNGQLERMHFEKAAKLASTEDDEAEALYRSAHSLLRDDELAKAASEFEKLATAHPTSVRAARSWLDAGRTWEKLKEQQRALLAYRQVRKNYPAAGGAITAAKREVALTPGPPEATWEVFTQESSEPSLTAALLFHWAMSLEATDPVTAIALYERTASVEPIPLGSYSDDALLRAAKVRRHLGDFPGALETLSLLTEQDTSTAIVGSYTRETYVEALFLSGMILRDDRKEFTQAHQVFVTLSERYPNSRLVDDALWEAGLTTLQTASSACTDKERLERMRPQSRYLRCANWLCPIGEEEPQQAKVCAEWASQGTKN